MCSMPEAEAAASGPHGTCAIGTRLRPSSGPEFAVTASLVVAAVPGMLWRLTSIFLCGMKHALLARDRSLFAAADEASRAQRPEMLAPENDDIPSVSMTLRHLGFVVSKGKRALK
jgi:hypothetical protein